MGGIPTNYHGEVVHAEGRQSRSPWCRACTRSARPPACRCTAPTASARTRCSTWWCSAARSPIAAPRRSSRARRTSALPADACDKSLANLDKLRNAKGGTPTAEIRDNMQRTMQNDAAVFRTGETLTEGVEKIREINASFADVKVSRPLADLELRPDRDPGTGEPARPGGGHDRLGREPHGIRGAHAREDFPDRDDDNWHEAHAVLGRRQRQDHASTTARCTCTR